VLKIFIIEERYKCKLCLDPKATHILVFSIDKPNTTTQNEPTKGKRCPVLYWQICFERKYVCNRVTEIGQLAEIGSC